MTLQPWWILAACIVLAIVLLIAGILMAALAAMRLKRRVDALQKSPLLGYPAEFEAYAHRINADLDLMMPLLARVKEAVASINRSLQDLKMPQAVLALRTAGAAIRLLLSNR